MSAIDPPLSAKSRLRRTLADFVRSNLDSTIDVYPSWPKTLRESQAFIMPQTTYTDETESTYCSADVSLRVVLVSPPFDWDLRHDWLDYYSDVLSAAFRDTRSHDGVDLPFVQTTEVARFGEAANLLGMNLNLSPISLELEP